jgi:hypothetical protein
MRVPTLQPRRPSISCLISGFQSLYEGRGCCCPIHAPKMKGSAFHKGPQGYSGTVALEGKGILKSSDYKCVNHTMPRLLWYVVYKFRVGYHRIWSTQTCQALRIQHPSDAIRKSVWLRKEDEGFTAEEEQGETLF